MPETTETTVQSERLDFKLSPELLRKLRELAAENRRSLAAQLREMIHAAKVGGEK